MTKVTIHLHSVHYLESGLALQEYMILLLYEQRTDWIIKELSEFLCVSERTLTRCRLGLLHKGYLIKKGRGGTSADPRFELTDKLYPVKKKVVVPAS